MLMDFVYHSQIFVCSLTSGDLAHELCVYGTNPVAMVRETHEFVVYTFRSTHELCVSLPNQSHCMELGPFAQAFQKF